MAQYTQAEIDAIMENGSARDKAALQAQLDGSGSFVSTGNQSLTNQGLKAGATQATPPINPNVKAPEAHPYPGLGANNDDTIPPVPATIKAVINNSFNGGITPQSNVLDQYASYTYSLSWYLLTPQQAIDITQSYKFDTSQWNLLVQSGGASQQTTGTGVTTQAGTFGGLTTSLSPATGRNEYFQLDYYLDNLILTSNITGRGTGTAHNTQKLEFTVTEPNGFTLISNLLAAINTVTKKSDPSIKQVAIPQAMFCMMIQFYGYDQYGNLITKVGRGATANGVASAAGPEAVVTKFYPFTINSIHTRIMNRQVEYKIDAACPNTTYAAGTAYGQTKTTFELTGKTLSDILSGTGAAGIAPKTDGREKDSTVNAGQVYTPNYAKSTLGNAVVTGGYSEATGIDFGQLSG